MCVTPRLGRTSGAGMRAWKAAVVRAGRKKGSMKGSGWTRVRMVVGGGYLCCWCR